MSLLRKLSDPVEYPVSLDEAKSYCRVDGDDDDTPISMMIGAATDRLEKMIDQKFISQQWAQYFDFWPMANKQMWWDGVREMPISELYTGQKYIELSLGPIISVDQFNTYADDGVPQLFSNINYIVDNYGPIGRIALKLGQTWPTTILRKLNGIEIKMTVGMAANPGALPIAVKQAVLEYVANLFEHRGDEDAPIPATAMMLLEPYRRIKVGGFSAK